MSAYVIVDIEVYDPETYKHYLCHITPTVAECGGRYVVRGGDIQVLSGHWEPQRLVIMEFEDLKWARHWASCEAYQPIHRLREQSASVNMVIVDGRVQKPEEFTPGLAS